MDKKAQGGRLIKAVLDNQKNIYEKYTLIGNNNLVRIIIIYSNNILFIYKMKSSHCVCDFIAI